VINPQVAINSIEEVAKICKGRICIKANLDDQHIVPLGSPQDAGDHTREMVVKLGLPQGGLGLEAKLIGTAPLQNIEPLSSTDGEKQSYYV